MRDALLPKSSVVPPGTELSFGSSLRSTGSFFHTVPPATSTLPFNSTRKSAQKRSPPPPSSGTVTLGAAKSSPRLSRSTVPSCAFPVTILARLLWPCDTRDPSIAMGYGADSRFSSPFQYATLPFGNATTLTAVGYLTDSATLAGGAASNSWPAETGGANDPVAPAPEANAGPEEATVANTSGTTAAATESRSLRLCMSPPLGDGGSRVAAEMR